MAISRTGIASTKRRRFLQLTDNSEGEMTIEAFIYRSDDYRSSTIGVPHPLSLYLESPRVAISEFQNSDNKLRENICTKATAFEMGNRDMLNLISTSSTRAWW